jgi:hypothetical protein
VDALLDACYKPGGMLRDGTVRTVKSVAVPTVPRSRPPLARRHYISIYYNMLFEAFVSGPLPPLISEPSRKKPRCILSVYEAALHRRMAIKG